MIEVSNKKLSFESIYTRPGGARMKKELLQCHHCHSNRAPEDDYCFLCGEPHVEVIFSSNSPINLPTEKPIHCPHCNTHLPKDSFFCTACGDSIFTKPRDSDPIHCPWCGEKSPQEKHKCASCNNILSHWFEMRGKIAEQRGISGHVILEHLPSGKLIHILPYENISIGRSFNSKIPVICPAISGTHCTLDLKHNLLIDDDSTNGTFYKSRTNKITQAPIDSLEIFSLGRNFDINSYKINNAYYLNLGSINYDPLCDNCTYKTNKKPKCNATLAKSHFFPGVNDREIIFKKSDGYPVSKKNNDYDYFTLSIRGGRYYFTDESVDIVNRLILSQHNYHLNKSLLKRKSKSTHSHQRIPENSYLTPYLSIKK